MIEKNKSVLVSNQVYEAIQPPTLDKEPVAKSTILYANRFSGVNPVTCTDDVLKDTLNSTVGLAGNNVLVQLRKKLSTFNDGPWYIDSRDGILYIHNRKYSDGTTVNYTYQREVGELLEASFQTVNVYKPFAGLGGMVDAMSKAVNMLTQQVNDTLNPSITPIDMYISPGLDPENDPEKGSFAADRQHSLFPRNPGAKATRRVIDNERLKKIRAKGKNGIAKEKASDRNMAIQNLKDNQAKTMSLILKRMPSFGAAIKHYQNTVRVYGKNSPEAKMAKKEYMDMASKVNLSLGLSPQRDRRWVITLYTRSAGFEYWNNPYPLMQEALDAWYRKNKDSLQIIGVPTFYGKPKAIHDGAWVNTSGNWGGASDATFPDIGHGREVHYQRYRWKFMISYYGLGSSSNGSIRADKVIGEPPLDNNGGPINPSSITSMLQGAAKNAAKGSTEKKLQATIKVVGNPSIEVSQQIGLYNVGKKHSGIWYVKSVSHSFSPADGYITNATLERQGIATETNGSISTVHTQKHVSKGSSGKAHSTNRESSSNDSYNGYHASDEYQFVNTVANHGTKADIIKAVEDIHRWHEENGKGGSAIDTKYVEDKKGVLHPISKQKPLKKAKVYTYKDKKALEKSDLYRQAMAIYNRRRRK